MVTSCSIHRINDVTHFVYNMKQVDFLRANRIVGRFIGTIASTQHVNEDRKITNYLPLKLTTYEVALLVEEFVLKSNSQEGEIELLQACQLIQSDLNDFKEQLQNYKDSIVELKNSEYINSRKNQLQSMRDQILSAKRKKLNDQLTKVTDEEKRSKILDQITNLEADFEQDLINLESNLKKDNLRTFLSPENTNTEIFLHSPIFYDILFSYERVSRSEMDLFVSALNDRCKYNAFKYMWNQGYHLTCGAKFGADFLVYPGKPSEYHSQFILVCSEDSDKLAFRELISYARMATSVKKSLVLASFLKKEQYLETTGTLERNDKALVITSINWSHF